MRFPLNPCDYHFQVLQRTATDPVACRFKAAMGFDVEGGVTGDRLQAAIGGVLREFPVLAGRLWFSPLIARPAWEVGDARGLIQDIYRFEDLGDAANAETAADAAMERAASGPIDLSTPPIVRLHHIRTIAFDRVLLTWPHPLMDGQGGYAVLRRLGESIDPGGVPTTTGRLSALPDSLTGSILTRVSHAWRGFRAQREVSRIQTKQPLSGRADSSGRIRLVRRMGAAADFEKVATAAKRLAPPGPGLYARHLAACTIRALRRLYDSHGWKTPTYAISFPMRPGGVSVRELPLGNYLVAAALHVPHEDALDWSRVGAAIAQQVDTFSNAGHDLDQWALLRASALMRPGQYHAMMKSSVAMTPLISGYSYFQAEDSQPIEQFADRPILRTLFGGVVTIPPGWNPAFWRHGPRLSMSLAWPGGFIADDLAIEFANLIEAEALGAT